ncbi:MULTISPECIES: hypothetical protein [Pseudomonas]|uniref:hypothetical protein n=1 Tax=Pseudomonas TaxID=286 RepID=UPI0015A1863A|nr:hypothetical protein [Pseudomonas gingeri]NVZ99447.1 hypothetical protein [Pseudomonas gingeri]NWA15531.1 hypothetical protein [Pseudomonas gingeri]NWA56758.1 hypothetical protein [Pseudomonas gingeri]NWA95252.1 hypothetical protein [Pseudomonas gingeri]NWB05334.1 hypothetical protein [Pseudomonas gingeri]
MEVLDANAERASVNLSLTELLIVNSALNEVVNGIEVFEFETRIGASEERVADLLGEIGRLIDRLEAVKRTR